MVFAIAAAVTSLLALHPFTLYPASLWLLSLRYTVSYKAGVSTARLAVCICAYNEEAVMGARIENLIELRKHQPGFDILVYVDCASDGTAATVESYGSDIRVVNAKQRHGKTFGMNTLIAMTDAEVIIFSDANVTFASDAVAKLVAPFADPGVGCVCGNLKYVSAGDVTSTVRAGSLYWRLEEWIKGLESRTGSVMGADGSIFAIRRSLHRPPPPDLIDDMFVSLSILCSGHRIVRVDDAVAMETSVSHRSEEFRRKVRIACQAFNVHRALSRDLSGLGLLDRYKYVSHKLLRWMTIYLLAASLCFCLAEIFFDLGGYAALMATFVSGVWLVVVFYSSTGLLGTVSEALGAFLATGIGVWKSLRGETFQTWNPPTSARVSPAYSQATP